MEIKSAKSGDSLTISLFGMLDTTTAPELQKFLDENLKEEKKLVLDLKELEYISSAGLRLILATQKLMSKRGELVITNVNDTVNEIFTMTGFSKMLTIK